MNDHELAGLLAQQTGLLLLEARQKAFADGKSGKQVQDLGDRLAHEYLVQKLSELRPGDAVLSEEGVDSFERLEMERTWIVDPLDGTRDYGYPDSREWAVHVALVTEGQPQAAAVSIPADNRLFGTNQTPFHIPPARNEPIVITSRSQWGDAEEVAHAIGGTAVACGSAGYKAMAVVSGAVDVYVHPSGLYEWDTCAPAAVAESAGFDVSGVDGGHLSFNKPRPVVAGLLISRPEYTERVKEVLRW
ncbi:MAG: 3'-phosphoadenosine 5'-phosphate phosphatase [Acidimicrobiales bacterium AG-410-I20]|nr:MAG: 3'-phosphoadenosine 5'-phosphate phosphatase [Acidimicrobiales bacterium AG-410-I20]